MTAPGSTARRAGFALLFFLSVAAPASADFQSGLTAYQRGDYATALREWSAAAESGNATAQLYLGLMYERGQGVPVNPAEARKWYERAAAGSADPEEKRRASDGKERVSRAAASAAVDAALVGRWRATAPDPATGGTVEMLWDIAASGDFSMTVAKRRNDGAVLGRSLEKGQFKARNGQWSYSLPTQTYEGSYKVLGADAFETTGPLGAARWMRVTAASSTAERPPSTSPPGGTSPPAAGGRVLMNEDFRAPGSWPEMSGRYCRASYASGGYVVENVAQKDPCLLQGFPQPAAARIEIAVKLVSGAETGAYGLVFGFQNDDGGFTLGISSQGYVRLAAPGGALLIPWTAEPSARPSGDAPTRLAVDVQGTSITAYVNGKSLGVVQAPRAAAGGVGIYVGTAGAQVLVSQLRVTALGGSAPEAPSPRILFDEDFRTARVLPISTECRAAYQDGGLAVEVAGGICAFPMPNAPVHSGDGRLELTLDLRRGAAAGPDRDIYSLLFGFAPDGSYYALQVGTRGFARLARWDGGFRELSPWKEDGAIRTGIGAVNQLAVVIEGRSLIGYVNGQEVARAQAPTAVSGRFGVLLNSTGMRAVVSRARMLAPPVR